MIKPFSTTGIGSFPHLDAREACAFILETLDIPFWPQLPKRSFRELMIPQYSEGMPLLMIDERKQTIWVERGSGKDLERFYESWGEQSRSAVSEDYARGFHVFLEMIRDRKFELLKGHVTGPLTFTLGLKDNHGIPVFFDEELREISLMHLKAKINWQLDLLREHADEVIIFVDEPILSALGSSGYLGVSTEEALRLLSETVGAITSASGIAGIHCCGNADWSLVMGCGAKIVNFDAYDYLDTLAIYPRELGEFLGGGGILAWGIVPTSDALKEENIDSLVNVFNEGFKKLSSAVSESLLRSQILLTPSCGTGSLTIEEASKAFRLLRELKRALT